MKEIILRTSTTSIIALLLLITCMGVLFYISATNNPRDATTRTQVVQGVFGLLMLMGGYYFGAAKNRPNNSTSSGDVNINPPAQDEQN